MQLGLAWTKILIVRFLDFWVKHLKLVAACAFGLEGPVKWELKEIGYEPQVISPGRIRFEGDWPDVIKSNLWLRVADRVLIEIAQFQCPDFDALFDTVKAMDWQQWLPRDAKFPVTARTRNSQLTSVPAIQRSTKKAIVESLQSAYTAVELPESGAEFRIDIALLDDHANITLDTSGASLHKRGYRTVFGEAPIKETLAAALVQLSVWNSKRPFIDPFCGSGTIPIEAAMIARNIAPGLRREFSFESWPMIESGLTQQFRQDAKAQENRELELQLSGTDTDGRVLKLARMNAERAGVANDIHFQQKPFEDLRSKREYGCLITNPPYGERLSERKRLLPLYQSIPAVLQRLPTWSHFIITNIPRFEGLIQQSATRKRKLFNGRIECMYYQFLGPKPGNRPAETPANENANTPVVSSPPILDIRSATIPVFGGLTDKDRSQADLFSTRLKKRIKHLRRWPTKRGITCFRVYERDIPELPFVVDIYEDYLHVTEFDRPHDRNPGRHAAWLDLMKKTLARTFEIPIHHVHFKSRRRQKGSRQHEKLATLSQKIVVQESGLKFLINLTDYVDTGLFLDHRKTRQMVREAAAGKHFLNLFAYTGSFSVYAAAGGAASTTTVDWSTTYQEWSRENMKLNGFHSDCHQFSRAGALEFLDNLSDSKKFDLAVVDPPTFSNSKRTEDVWDIQRDHAVLLNKLAGCMAPGAIVYFSNNFRKFQLDTDQLRGFESREISAQTLPEDFRNRRIHRCWILTRK